MEDALGWGPVSLSLAKEVESGREEWCLDGRTVEEANAGTEASVDDHGLDHANANVNAKTELEALSGEMDVGRGVEMEHGLDEVASVVVEICGEQAEGRHADSSAGLDGSDDSGAVQDVQDVQGGLGDLISDQSSGLSAELHDELLAALDVLDVVLDVVVLGVVLNGDESYRAKSHARSEKVGRGCPEAQVAVVVSGTQDEDATEGGVDVELVGVPVSGKCPHVAGGILH